MTNQEEAMRVPPSPHGTTPSERTDERRTDLPDRQAEAVGRGFETLARVLEVGESSATVAALDLDAIEAEFLQQCGPCDGGLPMGCTCSPRDFRGTMSALVAEVRRLRERVARGLSRLEHARNEVREFDVALALTTARAESVEAEVDALRAKVAAVEALAERLAASLALVLYDAHPVYGSTALWHGGIGGQAITAHCAIIHGGPPGMEWTESDLPSMALREFIAASPGFDLDAAKAAMLADLRAALATGEGE